MNETTLSTAFQMKLRKALPGAVVIKHADRSMIGMVDASVTFNNKTVWMEYKIVKPATKGVRWRQFMRDGVWSPLEVAEASPTQFEFAKALAKAGRCLYLFWVLDHEALRQRIKYITIWRPDTQTMKVFIDTEAVILWLIGLLRDGNDSWWLP